MILLKQIYESIINDSRIDFPQESLSLDVWDKIDGKYILKTSVKESILDLVQAIQKKAIYNIINDIRIIGSITSNQYTTSSDIDVHFTLKTVPKDITVDDLNKKLKKEFKDKLFIGTHPVEFYFQENPYQDLMSAGVYNIVKDEWVVGPTEVDLDFNPYEEFESAFPIIEDYCKRIDIIFGKINRNIENYLNKEDILFSELILREIKKLLAIKLELKEFRRSFSAPKSKEEAEIAREDKEWHKIDAVFKFVDKYGYLKKITLIENLIINNNKINKDIIIKIKEIL